MAYHALVIAHAQRTRYTHGSAHAKSSEAPTAKPAASACVSAGAHAQRLEPHQEEHADARSATHPRHAVSVVLVVRVAVRP